MMKGYEQLIAEKRAKYKPFVVPAIVAAAVLWLTFIGFVAGAIWTQGRLQDELGGTAFLTFWVAFAVTMGAVFVTTESNS